MPFYPIHGYHLHKVFSFIFILCGKQSREASRNTPDDGKVARLRRFSCAVVFGFDVEDLGERVAERFQADGAQERVHGAVRDDKEKLKVSDHMAPNTVAVRTELDDVHHDNGGRVAGEEDDEHG